MNYKIFFRKYFVSIFIVLLIGGVLLPQSPFFTKIPHRDSGVFLYQAQQILTGEIPYRDMWDHKSPLIYYIDAFGLFLGNGSLWGVWFLELASLNIAAFLLYSLIRQQFGFIPALSCVVLFLESMLFIFDGGNRPEEFALPFQFLILFLKK